ncbi:EAL domain-containing protein [Pseudoalteromonas sp. T1lg88]|uniref:EAL domain-containing protein n=1 Tax=Pseudoalteromonas sp. T1lg88 TaxID=2077104 RepID=UPI001F1D4F8F|nr:EAL domain-containing protein [Pseudoalteromonas sp. T1lg88]
MKRFTLLQFTLWLLALGAAVIVNTMLFHSYGMHKQEAMQAQLQRFLDLQPSMNAEQVKEQAPLMAEQLVALMPVQKLWLRDSNGEVLSSKTQRTEESFIAQMAQFQFGTLRSQFATDQNAELRVEFVADIKDMAHAFEQGLIYFALLITFLCFIPIASLKTAYRGYRRRIADIVSDIIDQFITSNNMPEPINRAFADDSLKLKLANQISPALNRLQSHLGLQIENIASSALEIKKEAYKDVITELGNRNMFVEYYERHIEHVSGDCFGCIALVRGTELQHINQSKGYQEGDEYIRSIADILTTGIRNYGSATVFRLNSSDFAVVLPNTPPKEAERFATQIQLKFNQYQKVYNLASVAYTGIVSFEQHKPLGELLANVDIAMSIAQSNHANAWHMLRLEDISDSAIQGTQNWRKMINELLEKQSVKLAIQPIIPLGKSSVAYSEIQARFRDEEDHILPTSSFMAMADQLGKSVELDQMIIDHALNAIKNQNLTAQYFGINVSAASAHDDKFMIWLERRLIKEGDFAQRLVFEISELGLQQDITASKRFISMLHRCGSRLTVERFGVGLTSFKFFREIKPDYIKMDASYTRGLEDDKNNQYFMRLMVDLAHRIGVRVFAEGVESLEEKQIIEQLCLDGAQGYFIEKPKELL